MDYKNNSTSVDIEQITIQILSAYLNDKDSTVIRISKRECEKVKSIARQLVMEGFKCYFKPMLFSYAFIVTWDVTNPKVRKVIKQKLKKYGND